MHFFCTTRRTPYITIKPKSKPKTSTSTGVADDHVARRWRCTRYAVGAAPGVGDLVGAADSVGDWV
jgi:hypothetical protein